MRGWIGPIAVAGIPVKVHLLALVLPLLLAGFVFRDPDAASVLGRVLLFDVGLVCVFAHEMGHALAARRRGMKVSEVLIHPFGGMALVERRLPPRWRARDDGLVAAAGPATNLALAGLLFLGAWAFDRRVTPWVPGGWRDPLGLAVGVNLSMGIINLVPVFPADGGHVLRSLLARVLGYEPATRVLAALTALGVLAAPVLAVTVGRGEVRWLVLSSLLSFWLGASLLRELRWAGLHRFLGDFRAFVAARRGVLPALDRLPRFGADGEPVPGNGVLEEPAVRDAFAAWMEGSREPSPPLPPPPPVSPAPTALPTPASDPPPATAAVSP